MTRALHRRLDRLSEQIADGRFIVISIAPKHIEDRALIDATLSAGGIERCDADVMVLIKRYGTLDAGAPCQLISVSPLPSGGRKHQQ
ncbi:MAG: hypothetical protein AB7O95_26545 [Geminicoccaceae bacterium]